MMIKEIHIYGFGRFENEVIHFERAGLQVIYGANESGKSTLMAFIEYMLFGFPKRSEKRLRYEPKTSHAYGGKLSIMTKDHGLLTIERKGGAAGTVTIVKEDGSNEEETFLRKLLGEVNHQTFRDVFSFNLDGLQKVNDIKSEQLGEYLFNAGLTGAQQLNRISDSLEEDQNKLFRPNGKNPVLNQKLNRLHELEQNVKQWGRKLEEYNRMKSELDEKRQRLSASESSKTMIEQKRTKLQHIQSIAPLIEKKNTIENQLKELPQATPFPEDGLNRYQGLKERLLELTSDREHVEDLIEKHEKAKDALQIDEGLMAEAPKIVELESDFRLYKGRQEDYGKLRDRHDHMQQEIDRGIQELGAGWTEESIRSTATDLVKKQQLITILKKHDHLVEEQKRLDEDLIDAREQLEENEAHRNRLKEQLLPEESIRSYREKVKKLSSQSQDTLKQQLEAMKNAQLSSGGNPINRVIIWAMIAIGVLLTGIWMMKGDYIAGLIIGISLCGTGLLLARMDEKDKGMMDREITELEKELNDHDETHDRSELDRLNQLLIEQQHLQVRYDHLEEQENVLEKKYQEVARRYDQWEIDLHQVKDELGNWKEKSCITSDIPDEMLLEVFERLDQLKKRLTDQSYLKKNLKQLHNEISSFEKIGKEICDSIGVSPGSTIESTLSRLSIWVKEETKKQEEKDSLARSMVELRDKHEGLEKKITHYKEEIESLLSKAEVRDEEAFREKGRANEKYEKWTEQLQVICSQLEASTDRQTIRDIENEPEGLQDLAYRLEEMESDLETITRDNGRLRDECSDLKASITYLEEDGSYSNQLHAFHLAQSEFIEQARKWAIYRTAQYVLDQAKQNYQSERQPQVIERAENYFSSLTEGDYKRIIAPKGEESFLIERKDRMIFRPEELSRATMEQLYLSLRFSLAEEYENHGGFPLIMDDILVNFDKKRRNLASSLIRSIAEQRQVLYFTCHSTTASELSGSPVRLPERTTLEPQTN